MNQKVPEKELELFDGDYFFNYYQDIIKREGLRYRDLFEKDLQLMRKAGALSNNQVAEIESVLAGKP